MAEKKTGAAARATELSLVVAAVFWGSNYAATKYAAEFSPLTFLVALRQGGLLLPLVLRSWAPKIFSASTSPNDVRSYASKEAVDKAYITGA